MRLHRKTLVLMVMLITGMISFSFCFDEEDIEKFKKLLYAYTQERPTTNLYLHIDKNIYAPGETLWFKAYFPSTSSLNNEGLFVRITDKNNKIVIEKEFLAYDIRAHGDITLPDTLQTGEYQLYAFTDKMMNFDLQHTFVQSIKINGDQTNRLFLKAEVADTTTLDPGKSVDIICKLFKGNKGVIKAIGTYILTTQENLTIAKGNFTTGQLGEARFSFKYPELPPHQNLRLAIKLNKDSSETDLVLNLPAQAEELNLKSYVEGGKLIEGIKSKLLLETSDQFGRPVAATIILRDKNGIVTKVKSNNRGQATIRLTPRDEMQYIYNISRGKLSRDFPFDLKCEKKGWTMRIEKDDKGFMAIVHNKEMQELATVLINTPDQILWQRKIKVSPGDSLILPLRDVDSVKQILNIALFNSAGQLENERLFLTQQKENYNVAFRLSKTALGKREKVTVNFTISDARHNPVQANVSVASIYEMALQEKGYKNILNNAYHSLNTPAQAYMTYDDTDKEFNDGLIAKTWWRHSWGEIAAYQPKGRLNLLGNSAGLTGQIKNKRNRPVKASNLVVVSAGMSPLLTDEKGYFSILPTYLVAEEIRKNYILAGPDFFEKHEVKVNEPEKRHDQRIALTGLLGRPVNFITATPPQEPLLPGSRINLLEVQIVANYKPLMSYEQMRAAYPSDCRDYVCSFGVLNCPHHTTGGIAPHLGQSYKYTSPETNRNVFDFIYTRCINCGPANDKYLQIKGIDKPREFKLPNYNNDFIAEENFQSTLYWNPNIYTNKNGEGSFEFYTGDLKGTYKIILQGVEIHSSRPVLGKTEFSVK